MTVITNNARAYVNHGRWIANCPRKYCANAIALKPKETTFHCSGPGGCKMVAPVEWPSDAEEIWNVLMERPVPTTRNWFPSGHVMALKCGLPHGQSPEDLREEAREYGE